MKEHRLLYCLPLAMLLLRETESFSPAAWQVHPRHRIGSKPFGATATKYQTGDDTDISTYDASKSFSEESSVYDVARVVAKVDLSRHAPLPVDTHPALVEFASTESYAEDPLSEPLPGEIAASGFYPIAAMLQGSASYIAAHQGKVAVFHIPGDILEDPELSKNLLSDLSLSWLLGIKLVLVIGSRYDMDTCDMDLFGNPHECYNTLKATDKFALRRVEEEAGYLRTEVERQLNRYLRMHGSGIANSKDNPEGNVVSGNFYTAQRFGMIRGEDFLFTGFTAGVHVENIRKVLHNNDVVLLTTVGLSRYADLVHVNGYHLTASVAAALQANKLIYMANEGSFLQKKNERTPIQEVPLSFVKSLVDYHKVKVHNTGFAAFEHARKTLEPRAVELLIHLGWASWAVGRGVSRAHIVNPSDGAILEELFTSKNGVNTCLYHDDENREAEDEIAQEDWDGFFSAAAA